MNNIFKVKIDCIDLENEILKYDFIKFVDRSRIDYRKLFCIDYNSRFLKIKNIKKDDRDYIKMFFDKYHNKLEYITDLDTHFFKYIMNRK